LNVADFEGHARRIAFSVGTTTELDKYPNAELVDGTDNTDHVCAAIVNGKLRIDATENQETVVLIAVSKPSATASIAWKKSELEFESTWLRARNFRISWLSLPASNDVTDQAVPMPETTLDCPTHLFSGLFNQPLPPASKLHLS